MEDQERKKGRGNRKYSGRRVPFGIGFPILAVLFFAVLLMAACVGSAHLGVLDALRLLLAKLPGVRKLVDTKGIGEVYGRILFQVRLPTRIFWAFLLARHSARPLPCCLAPGRGFSGSATSGFVRLRAGSLRFFWFIRLPVRAAGGGRCICF